MVIKIMYNLFLIYEFSTNGYNINTLSIISLLSILCAISVIVNKNPIVSVLFLIGLFAGISSYLIIIGLSFIGLSYLIVYIGAVSILFLFILMLINIRISELESNTRNSMLLAVIIIILFSYSFNAVLNNNSVAAINSSDLLNNNIQYLKINNLKFDFLVAPATSSINNDIFYVTGITWDGNLAEMSHITNIGNIMYTNYNMWLIMASYILLLAMIGSIVITLRLSNETTGHGLKNEEV